MIHSPSPNEENKKAEVPKQKLITEQEIPLLGFLAGALAVGNEVRRQLIEPALTEAKKAAEPLFLGTVKATVDILNSKALREEALSASTNNITTIHNSYPQAEILLATKKTIAAHAIDTVGVLYSPEERRQVLGHGLGTVGKFVVTSMQRLKGEKPQVSKKVLPEVEIEAAVAEGTSATFHEPTTASAVSHEGNSPSGDFHERGNSSSSSDQLGPGRGRPDSGMTEFERAHHEQSRAATERFYEAYSGPNSSGSSHASGINAQPSPITQPNFREGLQSGLQEGFQEAVKDGARDGAKEAFQEGVKEVFKDGAKETVKILGLEPSTWLWISLISGTTIVLFTFKGKIFGGDQMKSFKTTMEARQINFEEKTKALSEKAEGISQESILIEKKANVVLLETNEGLISDMATLQAKFDLLAAKFGVPLMLYETCAGVLSESILPILTAGGVSLLGYRQYQIIKSSLDARKKELEQISNAEKVKKEVLVQTIKDLTEKVNSMSSVTSVNTEPVIEAVIVEIRDPVTPTSEAGDIVNNDLTLEQKLLGNMRIEKKIKSEKVSL